MFMYFYNNQKKHNAILYFKLNTGIGCSISPMDLPGQIARLKPPGTSCFQLEFSV